jgi:hypothetical protein
MKVLLLTILAVSLTGCVGVPKEASILRNEFAKELATQNADIAGLNRVTYQDRMYYTSKEEFGKLKAQTEALLAGTTTDLERELIMDKYRDNLAKLEVSLKEDAVVYADRLRDDLIVSQGILALDAAANRENKYQADLIASASVDDLKKSLYQIIDQFAKESKPEAPSTEPSTVTPTKEATE